MRTAPSSRDAAAKLCLLVSCECRSATFAQTCTFTQPHWQRPPFCANLYSASHGRRGLVVEVLARGPKTHGRIETRPGLVAKACTQTQPAGRASTHSRAKRHVSEGACWRTLRKATTQNAERTPLRKTMPSKGHCAAEKRCGFPACVEKANLNHFGRICQGYCVRDRKLCTSSALSSGAFLSTKAKARSISGHSRQATTEELRSPKGGATLAPKMIQSCLGG